MSPARNIDFAREREKKGAARVARLQAISAVRGRFNFPGSRVSLIYRLL